MSRSTSTVNTPATKCLVALGLPRIVGGRHTQTGRLWLEAINTEVFFVTLDKSERTFSPSTRYQDFAVSPTRFHWQSQSTTRENSAIGQRHIRQHENGARFLLFVRPKKDDPFLFLGPLHYVSLSGSRPMSIYWDLKHPMPAWFFEICASLALPRRDDPTAIYFSRLLNNLPKMTTPF